MIDIDPVVHTAWRQGDEPNRLRLVVDDPIAAWPALSDVFDEVAATWSEAAVTPGGVLFRCTATDPEATLGAVVARLGERGVQVGRLTVDDTGEEQAQAFHRLAESTAWIIAWLVPLKVRGLDFTFRAPREWRNRRFPGTFVNPMVDAFVAEAPGEIARVQWSGGCFELPGDELRRFVPCWLEHGITTAIVLGDASPDVPVLVTSMRRGSELLGIGNAGAGLADDPQRAAAVLDCLTDVAVAVTGQVAYAVIGVHETGTAAAAGTPFREVVPATARVQHSALSLRSLDQWVLDAAPVQILTSHHQVGDRADIVTEPLPGGRRLVRIGTPADWFSGSKRRAQIRNRGREALAASLPPPKTPLPDPQV